MLKKNFFNFNFLIILFVSCFIPLKNISANENCSDKNLKDKLPTLISVETLDPRKWTKNLLKMLTKTKNLRKSEYISLDEYRDYHDAKIIVDYEGGIKCTYNGEVKIHGGTRNHRDNKKQGLLAIANGVEKLAPNRVYPKYTK